MYIGESHRSWGDRAGEHHKALETGNVAYATVRHHNETHAGTHPMFTYHHMGSYMTSLERQIWESLHIESYPCQNILNGKGEWGANLVPRAQYDEPEQPDRPTFQVLNRTRNQNTNQKPKPDSRPDKTATAFDSQLYQRKKRRRQELGELESQKPEEPDLKTGPESKPESSSTISARKVLQGRRKQIVASNRKVAKVHDGWKQTALDFRKGSSNLHTQPN